MVAAVGFAMLLAVFAQDAPKLAPEVPRYEPTERDYERYAERCKAETDRVAAELRKLRLETKEALSRSLRGVIVPKGQERPKRRERTYFFQTQSEKDDMVAELRKAAKEIDAGLKLLSEGRFVRAELPVPARPGDMGTIREEVTILLVNKDEEAAAFKIGEYYFALEGDIRDLEAGKKHAFGKQLLRVTGEKKVRLDDDEELNVCIVTIDDGVGAIVPSVRIFQSEKPPMAIDPPRAPKKKP